MRRVSPMELVHSDSIVNTSIVSLSVADILGKVVAVAVG